MLLNRDFKLFYLALFALLVIAGSSPVVAQVCGQQALGASGDFNLFILGDLDINNAGIDGRTAAGGQAQISNVGFGKTLTPAPGGRDDLIIGGDLFFNEGSVYAGNLIHGGAATTTRVSIPNGVVQQGTPLDFTAEGAFLANRSAGWASLSPTGTTEFRYGGLTLTGTEAGENVFSVSGADLSSAWGITIDVPAGASVLVNIDGVSGEIDNTSFSLQGATKDRVIYNFYEATTLDLIGARIKGSIVAPQAFVTLSGGRVEGTLAAASFSGRGGFRSIPFTGCLPDGEQLACGPPAETDGTGGSGPGEAKDTSSTAVVSLENFSESTFNDETGEVVFRLSCDTLNASPGKILVYDNDKPVPYANLITTSDSVRFNLVDNPADGRHDLLLATNDTFGGHILKQFIVWAGSGSFTTRVLDSAGNPVSDASVTVTISDDSKVQQTLTTDSLGEATFTNLPTRSYNVVARTADNRIGFKPHSLSDGTAIITLIDFGTPSTIDNNDFSNGLNGWEIGNAPVTLIQHVEGPVGNPVNNQIFTQQATATVQDKVQRFADRRSRHFDAERQYQDDLNRIATKNTDFDLQLATSGEGPQTISRTFAVEAGYKAVRVRYRFITTEVPGGYFGSQFNDFFNVSIRSENAGGSAGGGSSMNALGLQAFDSAGATGWNEVEIPVEPTGDNIQVDLSVANVADGALDSYLVVDAVKVSGLRLDSVSLLDLDNEDLQYFSAAPHDYFGGNVQVNGTITLRGPSSDSLQILDLQVRRGGVTIATGKLPSNLAAEVLTSFGSDETIRVSSPQLLFEIPSSEFSNLSPGAGGNVTLRILAITASGDFIEREVDTLTRFTRYELENRYGGRDEIDICTGGCGGDDWTKPGVRATAAQISNVTWGDFSNMHGGYFPPHQTHQSGNSIDGWIDGYDARDAAVAQSMIDLINDVGTDIRICGVTFTSAFANAIQGVTLNDGRSATEVFVDWGGHADHFHLEVSD